MDFQATSPTLPLPKVLTGTDRPISETKIITAEDMRVAGLALGVIVVLSIVMNIYTFYVVRRNWRRFIQFPFSQSNIICMFLSLADLVFAVFVGLPAALHLQFAVYFSNQQPQSMVLYARSVEFFLLEYVFLLRVVIIAVICIDRCIHILRPLAYKFFITHRVTMITCTVILIIPFVMRTIPNIIYLHIGDDVLSDMVCSYFYVTHLDLITDEEERMDIIKNRANNKERFSVPLTCTMTINTFNNKSVLAPQQQSYKLSDSVVQTELGVMIAGLLFSWLAILISNIIIMVVIVTRMKKRGVMTNDQSLQKKRLQHSIHKNLITTMVLSLAFLATNAPYVAVYISEYVACFKENGQSSLQGDQKIRLYMILSLFLSLLINPWLYLFRMETIRRFFPCFKGSISKNFVGRLTTTKVHLDSIRNRSRQKSPPERVQTRLVNLSCSSLTGLATSPQQSPGQNNRSKNNPLDCGDMGLCQEMEPCQELPQSENDSDAAGLSVNDLKCELGECAVNHSTEI